MILSHRERNSLVWREGVWVYKRQPKYLTDNEIYALRAMYDSGYVPYAEQVDIETIRIAYIETSSVTDIDKFMIHEKGVLDALRRVGLRHGDLTEYAVLVSGNRPLIIDWSESRTWDDPRPDKRPEGDGHWLRATMEKLCNR